MENVDELWTVRVVNGKLVIDESTDLPEGTEFKVARVPTLTPEQEEEIARSLARERSRLRRRSPRAASSVTSGL